MVQSPPKIRGRNSIDNCNQSGNIDWYDALPFQTPSKLSEFTEMISRSKGQISFDIGLSPISKYKQAQQK